MNLIDRTFGFHERALGVRSQRLEVLSKNIANADTPGFKARDVDFRQVLKVATGDRLVATNSQHYPVAQEPGVNGMKYRVPFNASFDGNTVEMSVEQAKFGKAAADYQATLSFLENRISGVRKALRGE